MRHHIFSKLPKIVRYVLYILFILLLILGIWMTYQVILHDGIAIDRPITEWVITIRNPFVTNWMKLITFFASVLGITMFTIVGFFLIPKWKEKKWFVGNVLGSVLISQVMKRVILRSRPLSIYHLVHETGFSFPSGHTMVGTSFYVYLIYLLWKRDLSSTKKKLFTILISLLMGLVGFSRIYLGVHYFSDVVSGMIFGFLFTIFVIDCKETYR